MAEHQRACTSCGAANEEDARFCEDCGAPLARVCGTCGVEAKATARFCRACGSPLDDRAATRVDGETVGPSRKTVTVMFADLAGSTTFEERVDAETAREVMSRYHGVLCATAEHHRAGVTKYIGDGFMAVWGVPEIGPDDAGRAVDAAVELQNRFVDFAAAIVDTHGVELALRVAVNTGEVVVGAGDADLVGDALNVAARLESECPRGRVVVGEETWRSTRGQHTYESLGQVQVKGRTAPVAVYQWTGHRSEAPDAAPFVGRVDEVRRLQSALDDAVATRAARLITVIGDPGVGKSRLAAEFTAAQGDTRVVEVRCDVEGAVALGPIVEVLRARDLENDVPANVPERDRILRALKGLTTGVPGSVEETFWGLRRFVELQARDEPLVIVIDDIQWADSLLLDFIEHLAEWVREVPVLVLALARPELREVRADLVTVGRWVTETLHLGGLDARATAELAAGVLGATTLPAELLSRLPSSTGGNPLFVRELVGMLVHDGVLVAEPAGWRLTIDVDAIAIPPTIQALLASRLERLDATDRRVLEIASVVGTDFSLGAVGALTEHPAAQVKSCLDRLRRLELAQPSGAYVGDEPVWRFHHVLVRDVAYRRLLKSDRARLHERLADWAESGSTNVAFDSDEMIARHLEAAYGYRSELGTLDAHAGELALRSARCYLSSARRALDRDELVSAGTQAARGAALAAADAALHADLLLVGCEAFLSAGDVTASAPLVDDLDQVAGDALAPWATCYRCQFIVYTDPARLLEVEARLQSAIDEFGSRSDAAGLAKAHRVRADTRARLGRIGDCEVDLFEALIAARQSGDHRQITAALGAAPSAALWGPSPVPKAGGRCLDVVRMQRMTTAAPSLEATSLRCLAVLELLRGRPDKARSMLAEARQVVADLGLRHGLMETELFAGIIESMVGDQVAAEPHFRTALEGLGALGAGADAGQAAALLARSVLAQGRAEEADRYATESERIAGHNLKTAIAWRAVRAEILAAQGKNDEAIAIAREAVTVAAGTDLVLDHAEACLALGRVLAVSGDSEGAKRSRDGAEKLYSAKEAAGAIGPTVEPVVPVIASPTPATSRLVIANRASESVDVTCIALQANDIDRAVARHSDRFVYDDRRRLSGDPVDGLAEFRVASARFVEQYPHAEWRTVAVRGDRLALAWSRWWDDAGNETAYYAVFEVDGDGLITHHVRYDGDDFDGVYRELERRYYADEGAAFAEAGVTTTEWPLCLNRGDLDRLFGELTATNFRLRNRSRSAFPDRSATEYRATLEELNSRVASSRAWNAAQWWLSPHCGVSLAERVAVGEDGQQYAWSFVLVNEYYDGRLASMCEFEVYDEAAAFAYAETLIASRHTRLAISNRASEATETSWHAMADQDVEALVATYADRFEYDDRRRINGDPITERAEMRTAFQRVFEQFTAFEGHVLAVRGEHLVLRWNRWADGDGNETVGYFLFEADDDGLTTYAGRFDEDDFDSAYRELERRYYAGEGAPFASNGRVVTQFVEAMDRLDVEGARHVTHPEFRWLSLPAAMIWGSQTVDEQFRWMQERARQVSFMHNTITVIRWIAPDCFICVGEVRARGFGGEIYEWTRIYAGTHRDGLLASIRQFELDDEGAAFAYADTLVEPLSSRLAVRNPASQIIDRAVAAMQADDVDTTVRLYADPFTFDDRRRLSGEPVIDRRQLRTACEQILSHYTRFEGHPLAVRGERSALYSALWADDAGNETSHLHLIEVDGDGRIVYDARFDGDDFDGAYQALDGRYYASEGAAYAESGARMTDVVIAHNRGDLDRIFGELTAPDFRIENRSRSAFPDRSAAELHASTAELQAMFASVRMRYSAVCWLSRNWVVARQDRDAVGRNGERYEWVQLYASEIRDGISMSSCAFDVEDEAAAFAYAEERMRAASTRLPLTNRASEVGHDMAAALQARDTDAIVGAHADAFVYDDRRRLSGDAVANLSGLRDATARIFQQYNNFEAHTLAVRGRHLALLRSRWSDDSGNEAIYLQLYEVGDDGRVEYAGRFDEDDFDSAYRELERRYYAGEGVAFADVGTASTEFVIAMNGSDVDELFDKLVVPGLRIENRSRNAFPDRSATQLRDSINDLHAMVASVRSWHRAVCWLSPTWPVFRHEREAVGHDGERYEWARILVGEYVDGRLASLCDFDVGDEDQAFAYAEERVLAASSRLAVANRSCEILPSFIGALRAYDAEASLVAFSERFEYDDHRRLSGDPIVGRDAMRQAIERIFDHYTTFDFRTLAVRGQHLNLLWNRWSDDDGNETTTFYVNETDDDGLIRYHGRFDEDDFEGAYRELERRYYAGDGAAYARGGLASVEWVIAMNHRDYDRVFGELSSPTLHYENRSPSVFSDRTAAEIRGSLVELDAMVASVRAWNSAMCWLSPTWFVSRYQREAEGRDGEHYEWSRIFATEYRDGRVSSICEFELADEEAAITYVEDRMRADSSRLAIKNRSCEFLPPFFRAFRAYDAEGSVAAFSGRFVYDDHRRLSDDPIVGVDAMRRAIERIFEQYTTFDFRTLAVRGQHLNLLWNRWSDDHGNETTTYYVHEAGDDGRVIYQGRFDEDDFVGAYRELERRYYDGEGAAYAATGRVATELLIAMDAGTFDRIRDEFMAPDFVVQNRSRGVFGDRTAAELNATEDDLKAMTASARTWYSTVSWPSQTCFVTRIEREAVGRDGEEYAWSGIVTAELRDGRFAWACQFELDDEAAAFAYAEERMQASKEEHR